MIFFSACANIWKWKVNRTTTIENNDDATNDVDVDGIIAWGKITFFYSLCICWNGKKRKERKGGSQSFYAWVKMLFIVKSDNECKI